MEIKQKSKKPKPGKKARRLQEEEPAALLPMSVVVEPVGAESFDFEGRRYFRGLKAVTDQAAAAVLRYPARGGRRPALQGGRLRPQIVEKSKRAAPASPGGHGWLNHNKEIAMGTTEKEVRSRKMAQVIMYKGYLAGIKAATEEIEKLRASATYVLEQLQEELKIMSAAATPAAAAPEASKESQSATEADQAARKEGGCHGID